MPSNEHKVKVYLDNCCFNRPYDDQSNIMVYLETEAKLRVQELIRQGDISLCWSFILDYENNANPFEEVRGRISVWKKIACDDCDYTEMIKEKSRALTELGLRQMDAAHIACAVYMNADYFITVDKKILNKSIQEIEILNPIDFLRRLSDAE